jgi:hypothetical protein
MVHQHRIGQAMRAKDILQPLADGFAAGGSRLFQGEEIAAVVIEQRQRADGGTAALLPLEIHLPELVWCLPLEASRGLLPALPIEYQAVPQEHAMHRDRRQLHPLALEQYSQLACSPVRPRLAQGDNPRLDRCRRSRGTQLRTTAALLNPSHAALTEPLLPRVPGRPRDPILPAQAAQTLPAA